MAFFAERANLTRDQVVSLTSGGPDDGCWSDDERLVIRLVDELIDTATVSDATWDGLSRTLDQAQLLDLLLLAGWYHAIAFAANGARVPLEAGAPRFADYS